MKKWRRKMLAALVAACSHLSALQVKRLAVGTAVLCALNGHWAWWAILEKPYQISHILHRGFLYQQKILNSFPEVWSYRASVFLTLTLWNMHSNLHVLGSSWLLHKSFFFPLQHMMLWWEKALMQMEVPAINIECSLYLAQKKMWI